MTPGTPYHVQLVLVAPDNTQTLGGDQMFTTSSPSTAEIIGTVSGGFATTCTGAPTGGGRLSGATVTAFPVGSNTPAGSATTDGNGAYQIAGLAFGSSYLVEFSDAGYTTQWFNGQSSASTANPVSLSGGNAGAGATLQPPPHPPCPPSTVKITLVSIPHSPDTTALQGNVIGGNTAEVAYGPVSSTWCTSEDKTGTPASTTAPWRSTQPTSLSRSH